MKIEDQVLNLELATKLKEIGIEQDSLYVYWTICNNDLCYIKNDGIFSVNKSNFTLFKRNEQCISAFTMIELLSILPEFLVQDDEDDYVLTIKQNEGVWSINYVYDFDICAFEDFEDVNILNALAKMYIYLKKNNIII